jgi:hypothetical protein
MFGIFNKKGISSALDECQEYHKKIGLEQELTQNQLATIKCFELFQDIEARYKDKGLTKYGGLAWFSGQVIGNTIKAIDGGNSFSPMALDLIQKFVFVSLAIGNSIPELKLTKADMAPIQNACETAMEWMKRNPNPLESELSSLMNR